MHIKFTALFGIYYLKCVFSKGSMSQGVLQQCLFVLGELQMLVGHCVLAPSFFLRLSLKWKLLRCFHLKQLKELELSLFLLKFLFLCIFCWPW